MTLPKMMIEDTELLKVLKKGESQPKEPTDEREERGGFRSRDQKHCLD